MGFTAKLVPLNAWGIATGKDFGFSEISPEKLVDNTNHRIKITGDGHPDYIFGVEDVAAGKVIATTSSWIKYFLKFKDGKIAIITMQTIKKGKNGTEINNDWRNFESWFGSVLYITDSLEDYSEKSVANMQENFDEKSSINLQNEVEPDANNAIDVKRETPLDSPENTTNSKTKELKEKILPVVLVVALIITIIDIILLMRSGVKAPNTEVKLESIVISQMPQKETFFVGDILDTTGLTLLATYSDGVENYIIGGFECDTTRFSSVGTQTITVSYKGKTAEFDVLVQEAPIQEPTILEISIASNPNKNIFTVGDKLDTEGLTLTVSYSDGTTQMITSGFSVDTTILSEAGIQSVKVSYGEKQTEFIVIVEEAKTADVEVGELVNFGTLTWRVLAVEGTKVLLITQDIITKMAYSAENAYVTWETSAVRSYLNNSFLNSSYFNSADREKILTTTVVNDDNPNTGTEGGNTTYDKVFLLSLAEASKYFSSDADRVACYSGSPWHWWLRSPGNTVTTAAGIAYYGTISPTGGLKYSYSGGVRPAIWVEWER